MNWRRSVLIGPGKPPEGDRLVGTVTDADVPPAAPKVGQKWRYQVGAISSMGDLRCRTFIPGKYLYNAGFWDQDIVRYHLHGAPAWLKIDEATGLITGTPQKKAVGKYCFMVYADILKVACDSQVIELEVEPK